MAWIRTIEPEDSTGDLRREYDLAIARAGRVYNIVKIMGLRPRHLRASIALYLVAMHGESRLSRAQRQMLAVVVSRANGCHY
ncbi:MAG: carboxymuconolactone decarboxylase family protein [Gemmatimonadetes bacterium]|nr:carboxymuconolactone decarboxylase family protein [Gemmatimonadota bacterium]